MKTPPHRSPNALLAQAYRASPAAFVNFCLSVCQPGTPYVHGLYVDAIAYQLERVSLGECKRLIINLPPRHLKSMLVSVAYVAWLLGHNPSINILCVSYSSSLSEDLHRLCRQVMEHPQYRTFFPGTVLRRVTDTALETTAGGGRIASSVNGTLTGRGADLIIIDDPLKAEDAYSDAARTNVNEWVPRTLISRLNNKDSGAIILVAQRVHPQDLSGHLIEQGGWDVLCLPLVFEEPTKVKLGPRQTHVFQPGAILHPERFLPATIEQMKREAGPNVFAAQYLQRPVPVGGYAIKQDWLRYEDGIPLFEAGDFIFQSYDTASSLGDRADYTACVTFHAREDMLTVVDVQVYRREFPELLASIPAHAEAFNARHVLIEQASSGIALLQALERERALRSRRIVAVRPVNSKDQRLEMIVPFMAQGKIFVVNDAPWTPRFKKELHSYPTAPHDDQVDAFSQGVAWFYNSPASRLRNIRPVGIPKAPRSSSFDENGATIGEFDEVLFPILY